MNSERHIVAILRELAHERGLAFQGLSHDWIIRLARAGQTRWVFGYDFDLNSCCAQQLCKDKAGCSMLLELARIPRVEHVFFTHPQHRSFVSDSGTWTRIHSYAAQFGFDVVCKPNDGSGGSEVTRTTSIAELEEVVHKLFLRARAITLSPYYKIHNEFRIIVLQGKCLLLYRKMRPSVIGDGRSTRLELLAQKLQGTADGIAASKALADLGRQKCDLSLIVPQGETWNVNWKHNLGLGSGIEIIEQTSALRPALEKLAVSAADALNLTFGSVDIVETGDDHSLKILEINAGVMMESFVSLIPKGRKIATSTYGAAVDAMFP